MKYRLIHISDYHYSRSVTLSQTQVRLRPRETRHQHCQEYHLNVEPTPRIVGHHHDYFGNPVTDFAVQHPHDHVTIKSTAIVTVEAPERLLPEITPPWERVASGIPGVGDADALDAAQFVFPSPLIPIDEQLHEYACVSFAPGRSILDAALDLMCRIHREFKYDKTATTVSTPIMDAFRMRRGVCQDFAHLMIACLRSLRLPARYVSGYVLTSPPPGKPKLVGADASHAWASLFIPGFGWTDMDPTNNQIPTEKHISIGWGRDYQDVSPVKGIVLGGGAQAITVSVDMSPI